MPRLQILELPTEHHGDDMTTPYLLIVDQVDEELGEAIASWPEDVSKRIGARQVLCFPGTMEIPANEIAPEQGLRNRIADELDGHAGADRRNFMCLDTVDQVKEWLRAER